jgi:condensation enzyme
MTVADEDQHRVVRSLRAVDSWDYWHETLLGAEFLAFPTDWPKCDAHRRTIGSHRFTVDTGVTSAVLELAAATGSSTLTVTLAAYQVFLYGLTNATDIVVPTIGDCADIVPVRTDVAGCVTFRDVVTRTHSACVTAYRNQVPFDELISDCPDLERCFAANDREVFAFQVCGFPSDIRPDCARWTLEIDETARDIVGCLRYSTNLFDSETIGELATEFRQVLRDTVTAPDALLVRPLGYLPTPWR